VIGPELALGVGALGRFGRPIRFRPQSGIMMVLKADET
jgi:hypothetical protein